MNISLLLSRLISFRKITTGLLLAGLIFTGYIRYGSDENLNPTEKFKETGVSILSRPLVTLPLENSINRNTGHTTSIPVALRQIEEIARLNGMDDPITIEQLTTLLQQGDTVEVRRRAILSLAETGQPEAIEKLIQGLADRHELVREATLRILISMQYPDVDLLLGQVMYGDPSIRIRLLAIELLSSRHNPSAAIFLQAATREHHPMIRAEAERVLGM